MLHSEAWVRRTRSEDFSRGVEPENTAKLAGGQTQAADSSWSRTGKPTQRGTGPDRRNIELAGELVLTNSHFSV